MKKVYVFLAEGFEMIEALTVVDILRRASVDVKTISITGHIEVESSHHVKIYADALLGVDNVLDASMIVLPGGMPGTNNLMDCEALVNIIKEYDNNKKYIAAICAAPSILGVNKMLEGKKVTSYPSHREKLLGAVYTGTAVEIDGHIITSKGMGTSIAFSLALVKILCGENLAREIKESIQYI